MGVDAEGGWGGDREKKRGEKNRAEKSKSIAEIRSNREMNTLTDF